MITESQFKTCARAFFPDCIFEKGKNSTYDYNIIKFNHSPFVIKFVDFINQRNLSINVSINLNKVIEYLTEIKQLWISKLSQLP